MIDKSEVRGLKGKIGLTGDRDKQRQSETERHREREMEI